MKVGLCLASHDFCYAWFSYDLAGLMSYTARERPDIELARFESTGTWLPQVRHRTVMAALKAECDWVLFIDSDMRFPTDTLVRLLARRETVVAANYTSRQPPFPPVSVNAKLDRVYTAEDSEGLEQVERTGLGCLLIRCDVLKAMRAPWFMLGWDPDRLDYTGEDAYFCKKIRDLGVS